MELCLYYQAHVPRDRCLLFVALLRSHGHVCFDRTLDVKTSTFEFFVPKDQNNTFLTIMKELQNKGLVVLPTPFEPQPHRM